MKQYPDGCRNVSTNSVPKPNSFHYHFPLRLGPLAQRAHWTLLQVDKTDDILALFFDLLELVGEQGIILPNTLRH